MIGVAASTIGAGAVIGSAVSAIRSENTPADVGSTETTGVVDTTETVATQTVMSEDERVVACDYERAVSSEDVSGDATRCVTERGGIAVASGWTSSTCTRRQTTGTIATEDHGGDVQGVGGHFLWQSEGERRGGKHHRRCCDGCFGRLCHERQPLHDGVCGCETMATVAS
ncbi:hypothetical protein PR003_g1785 [Phytophthora rubi]|uniref:Uncharacterized protein n=1 Tax=Phytophthora rubi TaxID=129364 RepID=A0A6A4G012_9STRA|nr:hypothetical protein PR002_g1844 [Phytophthora rubi]KAE9051127.1 hypothetical protein PR001_g1733 [Phytophthora rubi]KAE9357439.1 hypothetical protein PR003_g1785 [Phytophthora rubi]